MAKLFRIFILSKFQIDNHYIYSSYIVFLFIIKRQNISKFVSIFTGIFSAILSRCDGATIGESCDKENPIFIKLKETLGQAKAEEIMPQKTCDSGLECDCDVTQSEHEHGTRTSKTCRCVDSFSKGIHYC